MNKVFPEIHSVPLGDVPAGAIVRLSQIDNSVLALVTSHSTQRNCRSIVILNLVQPNSPSVIFAESWTTRDQCMYYASPMRFEFSQEAVDIDTRSNWWREVGIIASVNKQFLIHAAPGDRGGFRYVDVQTGAVFLDQMPDTCARFGVWSLWLRDPLRDRSTCILDFDIKKRFRAP